MQRCVEFCSSLIAESFTALAMDLPPWYVTVRVARLSGQGCSPGWRDSVWLKKNRVLYSIRCSATPCRCYAMPCPGMHCIAAIACRTLTCLALLCRVLVCSVMPCHAMACPAILCHATLCLAEPCHDVATPCMPCCSTTCLSLLCPVSMPCCAMPIPALLRLGHAEPSYAMPCTPWHSGECCFMKQLRAGQGRQVWMVANEIPIPTHPCLSLGIRAGDAIVIFSLCTNSSTRNTSWTF